MTNHVSCSDEGCISLSLNRKLQGKMYVGVFSYTKLNENYQISE